MRLPDLLQKRVIDEAHAMGMLDRHRRLSTRGEPVLVYGAGRSGVAAVQELFANALVGLRPVGFVDDDPDTKGRIVAGLPVLGESADLPRLIEQRGIRALVLAAEAVPRRELTAALAACEQARVLLLRFHLGFDRIGESGGAASGAAVRDRPVFLESGVGEMRATGGARLGPDWLSGRRCRRCGSVNVHRSRTRGLVERVRKHAGVRRPYRCAVCDWRGWLVPSHTALPAGPLVPMEEDAIGQELERDSRLARSEAVSP